MNSVWSWENIPEYFPSSFKMPSNALEHPCITFCHAMHIVAFVCPSYLFSFPHYFPVDPEIVVAPEFDYTANGQIVPAELPGKQTPLISPISPILSLLFLH